VASPYFATKNKEGDKVMSKTIIDLTGQKFGLLTVLSKSDKTRGKRNRIAWKCLCECGKEVLVVGEQLRYGVTKSCGCLKRKIAKDNHTKHGFANKERLYTIWRHIRGRCSDKNDKRYKNYGGRGITVCDEWLNSYLSFRNWAMENGYNDNLTIDRIDVNGNYEPSNCRWATQKEQANNMTTNHLLELNGEIMNIKQWSERIGIKYMTILYRLKKGWSIKDALTIPANFNNRIGYQNNG